MSHIGGALVTSGLGVMSAIVPGLKDDAVQTFVNTMAPVLGLAASTALNRALKRRSEVFTAGVLAGMGGDPDEATKRVNERADDEDTQEMLLEAFRRMMSAASVDVAPTIGYLTGQYLAANRKADFHFRSLGRLLSDLEPGDLGQLKRMLRLVRNAQHGVFDIEVNWHELDDSRQPTIEVDNEEIGNVESGERLLRLLRREGFAFTAKTKAGSSVDDTVTMGYDVARKLIATIDPEYATEQNIKLTWNE